MGIGQNVNFNMFAPYAQIKPLITPQLPLGGMYNFGFTPSFGSISTGTKTESTEDRNKKAAKEKAAADFLKRMEAIKLQAELLPKYEEQIQEVEEGKKETTALLDKAKKGKEDADGIIRTKETWEDYNKLPWWKKGLRGASHLVQGTWKLATGFFGYETNPKTGESEWNWKKGLKNAAIAAGCIALTAIPVVGPVISTGLLATGVVCGTIGTVNGVKKAMSAKTPEELDKAYQDIGSGLTIGISSAVGLRGLGKGLQASTTSGNIARSTSENAISQFVKDATINAYRATVLGVKTQKSAVAANGFWRTFGSNLKGMIPKLGKSKFEEAKNNTTNNIKSRLDEISQELKNPTTSPLKKSLLHEEQKVLTAQHKEIANTVTKDGWKVLKTDSRVHKDAAELKTAIENIKTNGSFCIKGKTFKSTEENLTALQEALSRSQKLSKEIQNLVKIRTSTIKKMATMKKFKSEVEAYTGKSRNSRLGRYYDAAKLSKSDITWKKVLISPLKLLWEATMIPFKPWSYVQNSATSTFYKLEETLVPTYEEGFLTTGFLAEALGMGDKVLSTKIYTKDEEGKDIEQVVPVTKEVVAQLEEQVKQYDEAIAKVQDEINKSYIA